jgi:hypothetical protein
VYLRGQGFGTQLYLTLGAEKVLKSTIYIAQFDAEQVSEYYTFISTRHLYMVRHTMWKGLSNVVGTKLYLPLQDYQPSVNFRFGGESGSWQVQHVQQRDKGKGLTRTMTGLEASS